MVVCKAPSWPSDGQRAPAVQVGCFGPVGFYYNAKEMEQPPQPPNVTGAMPDSFMQQERVYGFDFNKKYNVIILPNSEMLYASGMNVYLSPFFLLSRPFCKSSSKRFTPLLFPSFSGLSFFV